MAILFEISPNTSVAQFCNLEFGGADPSISNSSNTAKVLSYLKKNKTFLFKLMLLLVASLIMISLFAALFGHDNEEKSTNFQMLKRKVKLILNLFENFWTNFNEKKKFSNLPKYLQVQGKILSFECSKLENEGNGSLILATLKNCIRDNEYRL